MKEVNPWALQRITETLLEAEKRGLWQAADETIDQLQALYLDIEGELEERQDDTRNQDLWEIENSVREMSFIGLQRLHPSLWDFCF